jgi:PKD repeat protein
MAIQATTPTDSRSIWGRGTVITAIAAAILLIIGIFVGTSAMSSSSSPIKADFTASGPALSIKFDASASTDSKGTLKTFSWTFGDGKTDTGKVVTHAYTAADTYQVTLEVVDDNGHDNKVTKPVKVNAPRKLGVFSQPGVSVAPLGEVGPLGDLGSCWPAGTFNNKDGVAQAVTYLSGKDSGDTTHSYKGVAARDVAWYSQHASYYGYTAGQSDAAYTQGLVQEKLPFAITVQNTYCPPGTGKVALWKVQTLPVGESVFFKKGHAPSDVIKNPSVVLIPVKKSICGNLLLPPPASPAPQPTTSTPAPKPVPTPPVVPTPTPSVCIPPPGSGPENVCTHKLATTAPKPKGPVKCTDTGLGADPVTNQCRTTKYVPPQPTPVPGKSQGQGDSGRGAINTVAPSAAPHTTATKEPIVGTTSAPASAVAQPK